MKLFLIAALARNRIIGLHGRMPWQLPEDLQRFKRLTTGHVVLMGRSTYDSIGAPLPGRRNIVLTHRPIEGVETYPTLEKALTAVAKEEDVFVIGGGKVFRQTLPIADGMFLTLVKGNYEGDTFFPEYEHLIGKKFKEVKREEREGMVFLSYESV